MGRSIIRRRAQTISRAGAGSRGAGRRIVVALMFGASVAAAAQPVRAIPGDADPASPFATDVRLDDPAQTLRAALQAIESQRHEQAIWLLGQVVDRHPIVADHAALIQARLLVGDGHHEAAASVARNALVHSPASPLRPEFHALLGDALAQLGDAHGALAAWRACLDVERDSAVRARILESIASLEEARGLERGAADTYKKIWADYPASESARTADERLRALEQQLGTPLRSARDWRRRGDRLFRASDNEAALHSYEHALDVGLSDAEARLARRQRAHALFRMRRYPEALIAYGELPQTDDVPIWRARSMARAGQVPESIAEFERLAESGRDWRSVRARFLAALLLDGRQMDDRAVAHYRVVSRSARGAGMADAADWRLGWTAYRQGRYDEAVKYFDLLIARTQGDPIDQLRPRYWRARALARQGDARAESEFASIARTFPFTYYGWRSRSRTSGALGVASVVAPLDSARRIPPSALARAHILLEAGLIDAARDEVALLSERARALSDRLELAQLASDAGDFSRAQGLVVGAYNTTLARGPQPRYEDLWWYAWPFAYASLVDDATRGPGGVDPALVYAIMREESGYRAKVVSPVGARGLMQIMPTTGQRLAESMGLDAYDDEDLFEPQTNIALGSHYLAQLSKQFDGRLSAAIASYNAGPEAVSEWARTAPADDDEWVESIPYDQTREYVRRVLRSMHAYRVLY